MVDEKQPLCFPLCFLNTALYQSEHKHLQAYVWNVHRLDGVFCLLSET